MKCQIVNISKTFELIPNCSPQFITNTCRTLWEKSEYYTSWVAEKSVVDAPTQTVMFKKATQPVQLTIKRVKKTLQFNLVEEEKALRKKPKGQWREDPVTLEWWNSIGNHQVESEYLQRHGQRT